MASERDRALAAPIGATCADGDDTVMTLAANHAGICRVQRYLAVCRASPWNARMWQRYLGMENSAAVAADSRLSDSIRSGGGVDSVESRLAPLGTNVNCQTKNLPAWPPCNRRAQGVYRDWDTSRHCTQRGQNGPSWILRISGKQSRRRAIASLQRSLP